MGDNVYQQKISCYMISNEDTVFVDKNLLLKHGLKEEEAVDLILGYKHIRVKLDPVKTEGSIGLSMSLFEQLNLPENMQTNIFIDNYSIKIGPVVGVFVNRGTLRRIDEGYPNFRIIELVKANVHAGVLLYYFSTKDINWPKGIINGRIYSFDQNKWETRELPFPDILYDRGGGFLPKQLAVARYIRNQFEMMGIKKINDQHYFDKWDVHSRLKPYRDIAPFLPHTELYYDKFYLSMMLNKYACIFAKSCQGSNGRQVIKITKDNGIYNYAYYREGIHSGIAQNIEELAQKLLEYFGKKKFILQQGIDVLTVDGKAVDMRMLLQRDNRGKWQITSIPVRIANSNTPVTSTSTGAQVFSLEKGLQVAGMRNKKILNIKRQLEEFQQNLTVAVEAEYGPFGELGVDIAIDRNNKIWFIECNAKPGKDTVMLGANEEEKQLSFLYPLEYAKYLTGFC